MSTSSHDAQTLFSMTENDSDMNAGKKQKRHCDVSLSHTSSTVGRQLVTGDRTSDKF